MPKQVSEKMGISAGARVLLVDAPAAAVSAIELPQVVTETVPAQHAFDHIIFFVKTQAAMDQRFADLKQHLAGGGKLWVAWPKAGKLGTDLNIKEVIRIGYNHGLVESVNLRIDDVWTALKFTHPKPGKMYNNSYGTLPQP